MRNGPRPQGPSWAASSLALVAAAVLCLLAAARLRRAVAPRTDASPDAGVTLVPGR